jgi:hypothetical protein
MLNLLGAGLRDKSRSVEILTAFGTGQDLLTCSRLQRGEIGVKIGEPLTSHVHICFYSMCLPACAHAMCFHGHGDLPIIAVSFFWTSGHLRLLPCRILIACL